MPARCAASRREVSQMLKTKTPAARLADRRNAVVRVLVVEDDILVRRVMEETFAEAGYEVEATETVEAGLSLIESQAFDVIVADGRLPDGTGMEIADAAWERDIPTLVVTAYAFNLLRDKRDLASYNVLQKPLLPTQLIMAVTGLLKLRGHAP
jgi:CheY-like chemotaxis protein